mmetsp:Transcript_10507/g.27224  ORF Transcript_10507/g.27224 Transcript_10507/m.27224 type:complete len:238 (+) Transcript_10507:968-1681(+)
MPEPRAPPAAAPAGIESPKVRKAGTVPTTAPADAPATKPQMPPAAPKAAAPPPPTTTTAARSQGSRIRARPQKRNNRMPPEGRCLRRARLRSTSSNGQSLSSPAGALWKRAALLKRASSRSVTDFDRAIPPAILDVGAEGPEGLKGSPERPAGVGRPHFENEAASPMLPRPDLNEEDVSEPGGSCKAASTMRLLATTGASDLPPSPVPGAAPVPLAVPAAMMRVSIRRGPARSGRAR